VSLVLRGRRSQRVDWIAAFTGHGALDEGGGPQLTEPMRQSGIVSSAAFREKSQSWRGRAVLHQRRCAFRQHAMYSIKT
jgi:hypothetical protein